MIKKLALLMVVFSLIGGCAGQIFSEKSAMAPRPFRMGSPPKDADPIYLEGWNDGCDTGLSTMVTGYYKSFYAFKQDAYKVDDEVYYKAWKDAYTYCRHYSFRFTWDSYDKHNSKGRDNPLCVLCPNDLSRTQ